MNFTCRQFLTLRGISGKVLQSSSHTERGKVALHFRIMSWRICGPYSFQKQQILAILLLQRQVILCHWQKLLGNRPNLLPGVRWLPRMKWLSAYSLVLGGDGTACGIPSGFCQNSSTALVILSLCIFAGRLTICYTLRKGYQVVAGKNENPLCPRVSPSPLTLCPSSVTVSETAGKLEDPFVGRLHWSWLVKSSTSVGNSNVNWEQRDSYVGGCQVTQSREAEA